MDNMGNNTDSIIYYFHHLDDSLTLYLKGIYSVPSINQEKKSN